MKATGPKRTAAHSPAGRIESLDTIRGLAALAVLLSHTIAIFSWRISLKWMAFPFVNIMFDGRSAVTMFFVLSGFVLARPYVVSGNLSPKEMFVPVFYLRRLTRIWIPWFIIFCLSAAAKAHFFREQTTFPATSQWMKDFWHLPLTFSSFFRQCTFTLHDPSQLLLPQDWSLGVELKGSALIPFFLILLRRHISVLLGASIMLLIFLPTGEYYLSFVLGMLAARFHGRAQLFVDSRGLTMKCGILVLGLLFYQARLPAVNFFSVTNVQEKIIWCLTSVGCILILASTLGSRKIQTALTHPFLLFFGRISYSVFLLQFFVILCVLPPAVHALNKCGVNSDILLLPIILFVSLIVTSVLGAFSFYLIEKPSIKFGNCLASFLPRLFRPDWQRRLTLSVLV